MPDDLYHRDVLAWSEHQASLLRRVARGDGIPPRSWPAECPCTLDQLLHARRAELEALLTASQSPSG